ncbi:hypothetical protein BDW59DRAFT_148955 [Aspergillus cavernicola]|uniref:Ubiquitin-like protease family profile domain-containing protein n=1 Tax=Aspergillus cavernicola TaxID=176166 RepID=A0ABR4I6N6_9EURO
MASNSDLLFYFIVIVLLFVLSFPLVFPSSLLSRHLKLSQIPILPRIFFRILDRIQYRDNRIMENPTFQNLEVEDVIMLDASLLSSNESPLGSQRMAFDPMDISTPPQDHIPQNPTLQTSQPAADQTSLPWLGPSILQTSRRAPMKLPLNVLLRPQRHFRFSPNSKPKPPINAPVYHHGDEPRKPSWYRAYKPTAMTTHVGLLNYSSNYSSSMGLGSFQKPVQIASAKTSRGSSFSSLDTQKSTEDGKANSFDSITSASTVQSSLPRKRSVDDSVQNEWSQLATADAPSEPSPKYRRVSEDGFSVPSGNSETSNAEQPPTLAQPESSFPSSSQSALTPITASTPVRSLDTTNPETPVSSGHDIQRNNLRADNHIPGCWPITPGSTPYKTPCSPYPRPDVDMQTEEASMSNALPFSQSNNSHELNPSNVATGEINSSIDTVQDGQPLPSTQTTSWYDSLQGMAQTVANVCKGALAMAGSFRERALVLIRHRHSQVRGSSPVARYSPVRVNLRTLPLEQRQRVKANQWRKDRGHPIIKDYPFPKLSFDSPQVSPIPDNIERSVEPLIPGITATRTTLHRTQPKGTMNHRISKPNQSRHGRSTSGVRKASRLDSLSPQLKNRMLLHPTGRVRDRERGRRELALREALRTGNFDAFNDIIHPSASVSTQEASQAKGIEGTISLKPKHRVRFQEPLVTEYILDTRSPVVTELAPHLRPPQKIAHPATVGEALVEQKKNIPPESITPLESIPEVAINEDLEPEKPSGDPWLQLPEFPLGRPVSAVSLFYPTPRPLPPGRTESIYADEWRKIEKAQKINESPTRIRPEGAAVRPLSPKWETRLEEQMRLPDHRNIATTLSGDPLTKKDLATCFTPRTWLNDEVINSYLVLIIDYLRRTHGNAGRHDKPRFHAFNSFFFSNLRDKGYESVRRWATRAKIGGEALLNVDTVFIPVHNCLHWTLIVVKPSQRTIEHFDSIDPLSPRHVGIVKNWLRDELDDLYVDDEWTVLPSDSPKQDNGTDCGVFLLSTAKAVAIGIEPLCYGARDIRMLRRKIVAELMHGRLEGEFNPADANGEVLL